MVIWNRLISLGLPMFALMILSGSWTVARSDTPTTTPVHRVVDIDLRGLSQGEVLRSTKALDNARSVLQTDGERLMLQSAAFLKQATGIARRDPALARAIADRKLAEADAAATLPERPEALSDRGEFETREEYASRAFRYEQKVAECRAAVKARENAAARVELLTAEVNRLQETEERAIRGIAARLAEDHAPKVTYRVWIDVDANYDIDRNRFVIRQVLPKSVEGGLDTKEKHYPVLWLGSEYFEGRAYYPNGNIGVRASIPRVVCPLPDELGVPKDAIAIVTGFASVDLAKEFKSNYNKHLAVAVETTQPPIISYSLYKGKEGFVGKKRPNYAYSHEEQVNMPGEGAAHTYEIRFASPSLLINATFPPPLSELRWRCGTTK